MKPSITFALNDLFKDSNDNLDTFWALLLEQFEFVVSRCKWPRAQHPERVIMDLRPFFECNNVYDLLRKGDEDIRLVIQETGVHSGMTLKIIEEVRGIFPKSPWFIQRQPKRGNWEKKKLIPLQNTLLFVAGNAQGAGEIWTRTVQPDGVGIVERLKAPECGPTPSPMSFNPWEPVVINLNMWGS